MPRRMHLLPRQFKQAHRCALRDKKSMRALAEETGYSTKHCYRLCGQYGLPVLSATPDAPPDAFKAAHAKARTLKELGALMGITKSAAYERCLKLGLHTNLCHMVTTESMALAWESYRGLMSVADVARILSCSYKRVRTLLWACVKDRWDREEERPPWPKPMRLDDIRVYLALDDDPALIGNVARLCDLTGINERIVDAYIRRIR